MHSLLLRICLIAVLSATLAHTRDNESERRKRVALVPLKQNIAEPYLRYFDAHSDDWRVMHTLQEVKDADVHAHFKLGFFKGETEKTISSEIIRMKGVYADKCRWKDLLRDLEKRAQSEGWWFNKAALIHPTTYCVRARFEEDGSFTDDELAFVQQQKQQQQQQNEAGQIFVWKSPKSIAASGFRLISDITAVQETYFKRHALPGATQNSRETVLLQTYITDPLLVTKHKFDVRAFALVLCTGSDFLVLYHEGYARRAPREYDKADLDDLARHVPAYAPDSASDAQNADSLHMTMQDLEDNVKREQHIMDFKGEDPWQTRLDIMKEKIAYGLIAGFGEINNNRGTYHIFACDFVIDNRFDPWLIDVNTYPSLRANSRAKGAVVQQMTDSAMALFETLLNDWDRYEKIVKGIGN